MDITILLSWLSEYSNSLENEYNFFITNWIERSFYFMCTFNKHVHFVKSGGYLIMYVCYDRAAGPYNNIPTCVTTRVVRTRYYSGILV